VVARTVRHPPFPALVDLRLKWVEKEVIFQNSA
jgi:hypothetical protein